MIDVTYIWLRRHRHAPNTVLADTLYAAYSLATHPQNQGLVVGDTALVFRTLHFAVRKDFPDAQTIIDGFDGRVRQMLCDGSYNRLLGLEWSEAEVDGRAARGRSNRPCQ